MNKKMESERLLYRSFELSDDVDVFDYASDDETTKYLTWPTHKTIEQTRTVLEKFYIPNELCFAIVEKAANKCIGSLNITLENNNTEASFGLVLSRKVWGRGFATEALSFAIKYAFEVCGVSKVRGEHFVGNDASGKVMQKAGMNYVGESQFGETGKIVKVYELVK